MRKVCYCSLCSVYNQRFFDTQTKKVIFSNDFCENLVEFSISEIHYKAYKVLPTFKRMNTILNCKDGVESPEEVIIELEPDINSQIDACYQSYITNKEPLIFLTDCVNYCKKFSFSSASEVFEGNLGRLEYVYTKLVNSGLIANDFIFPEIKMETKYDFFKLNPEFFENKLSFEDFEKYESVFEPNGLEPFTQSTESLYHYHIGKDSLRSIKSSNEFILGLGLVNLMIYLIK